MEETLLNPNQSGFRLSDSCINQLLAISHEIMKYLKRLIAIHLLRLDQSF